MESSRQMPIAQSLIIETKDKKAINWLKGNDQFDAQEILNKSRILKKLFLDKVQFW